ncbi:MAG TPA: shikimate dehydrogenase [Candidatus Saccharimonadales bacterium]|nr:shikimate dehydrogenase [Candidatus Saccharimonadales bacterium]
MFLQFELRPSLPYNGRVSDESQRPIDAATRLSAVFGHPVRHSASPAMQNAGMAALQLNWRYLAFDVHPDHLRAAIEGARLMGFIGLNLTVPHKLLALEMVNVVDDPAKSWGAVNTIVFETRDGHGQWVPVGGVPPEQIGEVRSRGCNTDADAIVQSLKEEFSWQSLRGASVLLLGAGGAARTAALRLAREGIGKLFLVNRTAARAAELADAVRKDCANVAVAEGYPAHSVDLLLNATSLGLKPEDPPPVDVLWLRNHPPRFVYDMIYRPMETGLLREAKSAGCRAANGVGMLLHQGARSLELWTGRPAPLSEMRRALEKNVYG